MIPRKIHYCWFGRSPLPESARKCIASWRRFLPGYEIVEWNEDNFDVDMIPYTAQAYAAGKYAFVSDFARFHILYHHGGLYFDTDVEVIAPMDDIIAAGPFMGFEIDPKAGGAPGLGLGVNPGLGLGVNPGLGLYREIISRYEQMTFIREDGSLNTEYAVVRLTTDVLIGHGLRCVPGIQTVGGVRIYPAEYFNPLDDATGRLRKTPNTRTIHWFTKSWCSTPRWRVRLGRLAHRIFGVSATARIKGLFTR